jgi:hypothetical protein
VKDFPAAQIVSKVLGTVETGQAWLEWADGAQWVRCTKCGLYEMTLAMAPGLKRLREHAVGECGMAEESADV